MSKQKTTLMNTLAPIMLVLLVLIALGLAVVFFLT
jgi:hypothetical protein